MSTPPIAASVPPTEAHHANKDSGASDLNPASALYFTGSCLCHSVTYTIDGSPFNTVICHCLNCSKASGSAFQYNAFFNKSTFHLVTSSTLKTFVSNETDTGTTIHRNFCGNCGSQLFTTNPTVPDLVIVMLGTIDGKRLDKEPQMEFYCKRSLGWMGDGRKSKKFQAMV